MGNLYKLSAALCSKMNRRFSFPKSVNKRIPKRNFFGFLLLLFCSFTQAQITPAELTTFGTTDQYSGPFNAGGSGHLAANLFGSGWDFRVFANTSNSDIYVNIEPMYGNLSYPVSIVSGNGAAFPNQVQLSANDGKLFTLNALDVLVDGISTGAPSVQIELVGYRQGSPVSGAVLVQSLADASNGGPAVSFNVAGNADFDGIDAFRIRPVSGYTGNLGAIVVDNINATNFRTASTLPVTWHSFTAAIQGGSVALNWSTASEQNTKDFLVQHSTDGRTWNSIGTRAAAGNSSSVQQYVFVHQTPPAGINFYRLLQRDRDGKTAYSKIVTADLSVREKGAEIYPNPVRGGVLQVKLAKETIVQVYNSAGNLVLQQKLGAVSHALAIAHLPAGFYTVKSGTETNRFVKQ